MGEDIQNEQANKPTVAIITDMNEINTLAFRCFTMVVKRHNLYVRVRCGLGQLNPPHNIFMTEAARVHNLHKVADRLNSYNPFKKAKNLNDVYRIMYGLIERKIKRHPTEIELQTYVQDSVNSLIRCLLERIVPRMDMLGKIGEEVYNLTCQCIYGGEFQDFTATQQEMQLPHDGEGNTPWERLGQTFEEFIGAIRSTHDDSSIHNELLRMLSNPNSAGTYDDEEEENADVWLDEDNSPF